MTRPKRTGLVDPHPEGDRRADDAKLVAHPPLLHVLPRDRVHVGVVVRARHPRAELLVELARDLLAVLLAAAVHDPRLVAVALEQDPRDVLGAPLLLLVHLVEEVRPVERRGERDAPRRRPARPVHLQDRHDVELDALGRRRRQRDERHVGEVVLERRQLFVVGTEVVAPLRHAVRLVDDEARELAVARERRQAVLQLARRREPLGRHVDEEAGDLVGARRVHLVVDLALLVDRLRRRELERRDALVLHRGHLVLDERDERADDDRDPRQAHRRQLVAQRLAAAGGHDHEDVVPGSGGGEVVREEREVVREVVSDGPYSLTPPSWR